MKKIFLFFAVSSIIFAQESNTGSLLELKYQLNGVTNAECRMQNTEFSIQHPASNIQHLESSIQNPVSSIQQQASRKNPGLAILFSLILPGMGELYADGYESGKYFTIADGVLWGVFIGFNSYANWKEDNYRSFAQSKAGVSLDGKDENYFTNVGIYMSVDEYNRAQELNREFGRTYNHPSYYWKWSDNDQRKEYRDMWTSSESAYNNVRFAVGALVLNRLISAINAVRLVSAYNKNLNTETEVSYYFSYQQSLTLPSSLVLNISKSF